MKCTQVQTIVYGTQDALLLNPHQFFPERILASLEPYHIFTGVGVMAVIENQKLERHTFFFRNTQALTHSLKKKGGLVDLVVVTDCFFAYVVTQNTSDPFQGYGV